MVFNERLCGSISNVPKIAEVHFLHKLQSDDPKNEVATE